MKFSTMTAILATALCVAGCRYDKAGKNGKVPASEREYLMFGNDYRRF